MQGDRPLVDWGEFAERAPELAAFGLHLLNEHRLAYLATIRRDGSPHLHPVTPVLADGGLYVTSPSMSVLRSVGISSATAATPWPAPLGEDDGEFVISGRVRRVRDEATRGAIAEAATHVVHESDWLFEFLIQRCHQGYWVNAGRPGTYPVYRRWPEDA